MKKFLAGAAALALAAAATPASAITWGEPDNNAHPHVVVLLFQQAGGLFSCTGTLLSPTVVLTAGHCTESGGVANTATWVRSVEDVLVARNAERAVYPVLTDWLNGTFVTGTAVPHPNFNDFAEFPNTFDIGVVLLDSPIYLAKYGQMPLPGQFDYLKTKKGSISDRQVSVVGFGLNGVIRPEITNDFARYKALSAVTNTGESGVTGPQNFQFTNNPGQGSGSGGTCSGDSGGPAFWIDPSTGEETTTVMAVNSYGIAPNCTGTDYQFRTDIDEAQNFVLQYLP